MVFGINFLSECKHHREGCVNITDQKKKVNIFFFWSVVNMSDSSEDENFSRFKEAVDTTFVKLIEESRGKTLQCVTKAAQTQSERFLEVSAHYNDVKVPKEMQKCIGDKISAIINNLVEYVDIGEKSVKQCKIKGGVKLFNDSEGFLSCKEVKDTLTESHNRISKKSKWKKKRRLIDQDVGECTELDKIKAAVITGDYVLSKEETQHWVSRRKKKLFTYKAHGRNKNILLEV